MCSEGSQRRIHSNINIGMGVMPSRSVRVWFPVAAAAQTSAKVGGKPMGGGDRPVRKALFASRTRRTAKGRWSSANHFHYAALSQYGQGTEAPRSNYFPAALYSPTRRGIFALCMHMLSCLGQNGFAGCVRKRWKPRNMH
jgi:hypothetical protein